MEPIEILRMRLCQWAVHGLDTLAKRIVNSPASSPNAGGSVLTALGVTAGETAFTSPRQVSP